MVSDLQKYKVKENFRNLNVYGADLWGKRHFTVKDFVHRIDWCQTELTDLPWAQPPVRRPRKQFLQLFWFVLSGLHYSDDRGSQQSAEETPIPSLG